MFLQIITSGTKLQNALVLCEVICQVETGRTRSPSWSVFFCFFTELTTAQYCQMHCKTLQRALCRQQSSVPFWVRVLQHPILQRDALCECIPRFATQLLRTKHTKLYAEHSCRFLPLRSWKCKLLKQTHCQVSTCVHGSTFKHPGIWKYYELAIDFRRKELARGRDKTCEGLANW